jgi:hypothetical protein
MVANIDAYTNAVLDLGRLVPFELAGSRRLLDSGRADITGHK